MSSFNDLLYDSGPISFSEYIFDKQNIIHKQLFNDALTKLGKTLNLDTEDIVKYYRVIEDPAAEYWKPSSVTLIAKDRRQKHRRKKYDLTPYWNTFKEDIDCKTSYLAMYSDSINDVEVIYVNYVTGEATLRSKLTGGTFKVPFNYLDSSTQLSDDILLNETFTYKYNNL